MNALNHFELEGHDTTCLRESPTGPYILQLQFSRVARSENEGATTAATYRRKEPDEAIISSTVNTIYSRHFKRITI
ncbi:unnamed protein product [Clonostachys rosea]|uniref:Velvet domain-containing protein n=1 Tax=Bionectria ochroleuca TaxID=29856 RepID=A0ABY6U0F6_BIOOC|nr:unnamed protein product [Clonostachys rosea]